MAQQLDHRTVLVTGANGGLGAEFVRQAWTGALAASTRRRGHRRTGATSGSSRSASTSPTRTRSPQRSPRHRTWTSWSTNAGIAPASDASIANPAEESLDAVFATNTLGPIRVAGAFAPVLAANGGGAVLNVLSLAAWIPLPTVYAASKAAAWSATNGLRVELADQGTTVTGLVVGMVDTAMGARFDVPKSDPADVVAQAYDGVVSGAHEVLADEDSRMVKSLLSRPAEELASVTEAAARAVVSG